MSRIEWNHSTSVNLWPRKPTLAQELIKLHEETPLYEKQTSKTMKSRIETSKPTAVTIGTHTQDASIPTAVPVDASKPIVVTADGSLVHDAEAMPKFSSESTPPTTQRDLRNERATSNGDSLPSTTPPNVHDPHCHKVNRPEPNEGVMEKDSSRVAYPPPPKNLNPPPQVPVISSPKKFLQNRATLPLQMTTRHLRLRRQETAPPSWRGACRGETGPLPGLLVKGSPEGSYPSEGDSNSPMPELQICGYGDTDSSPSDAGLAMAGTTEHAATTA